MTKFELTTSSLADAFAQVERNNLRVRRVCVSGTLLANMQRCSALQSVWTSQNLTLPALIGKKKAGTIWGADLFVDVNLDTNHMVLYSDAELNRTWDFTYVPTSKRKNHVVDSCL